MVGSTRHRADAVVTGGETTSDRGREDTLAIASVVDTLEEDELLRVGRVVGREVVSEVLDGNVGVADDTALAVEILRSRVVRLLRVGEGSGREVLGVDNNVERLVLLDGLTGLRVLDDAADHPVGGRDLAHDDTVAGAALDLLTIGQGLAGAEVDEVGVIAAFH